MPMVPKGLRAPFFAGLVARLAIAPFLLQWFHPDERQVLEFAHFHARGTAATFFEWEHHLRNQTAPWLLSWALRALDSAGLGTAWVSAWALHSIGALWGWAGLWALVLWFREEWPEERAAARGLAWFFALFWGFSFLHSRMLLEALSFPAAALGFLALHRGRLVRAGIWVGLAAFLRYPSVFFAVGAGLSIPLAIRERWSWQGFQRFLAAALAVFAVGGLADLATYGWFLKSAGEYVLFNWPHGPVERFFGSDSLAVYLRWFSFLFTPWLGWAALALGLGALVTRPRILVYVLPYAAAHVWTPHREPRFMLPLVPFLALAAWEAWLKYRDRALAAFASLPPAARSALVVLAWLHLGVNFAWFPLNAWGQWSSLQGALVRGFGEIRASFDPLLSPSEPLIDAIVPQKIRWAGPKPGGGCQWMARSVTPGEVGESAHWDFERAWVLSARNPGGCESVTRGPAPGPTLARLLRVRSGKLWRCFERDARKACGWWEEEPDRAIGTR